MLRDDIERLLEEQRKTTLFIEDATKHLLAVLHGETLDANYIRKITEDYRVATRAVRNETLRLLCRLLVVCQNHKED